MKVLINDANILIDLVKIELLEAFSNLDFELYTTDFVLEELNEEQKKSHNNLLNQVKLDGSLLRKARIFKALMIYWKGRQALVLKTVRYGITVRK